MNSPRALTHPLITAWHLSGTAVVVIRQSSMAQVKNNEGSAALQRAQSQIARDYGFARVLELDQDMAKSATTTVGRSGWEIMLRELATGVVRAIFAFSISRLSRAVRDFAPLLALCRYHKALLVIDGQVLDPSNPHDTMVAHVHSAASELDNVQRAHLMRQSRRQKAQRGAVVTQLPIGWIKLPDGSWDFDPEVAADIRALPGLFWRHGSLRQMARAMNAAGMTIPARYAGRLERKTVTVDRLRSILLGEAYVSDYVYGKTESGVDLTKHPDGRAVQVPVPEDRWIRVQNLYPAYFMREEQDRIRAQVQANDFGHRRRPGRGKALCQSIVTCGVCGSTLTVTDPQRRPSGHRYQCSARAGRFGEDVCMSFAGEMLDSAIERLVLQTLTSPPRDLLEEALREARRHDDAEFEQRQAEFSRLKYEEQRAQDRLLGTDERHTHVYAYVSAKLQEASAARETFERQLLIHPISRKEDVTSEELRRLLDVAGDIPGLWRHPVVTMMDRKRVVRALIERIVVHRTADGILATVLWCSGARHQLHLRTQRGVASLVCDLSQRGLSVEQIRETLRAGDPTTGLRWAYTASAVYQILKRFGVRPNPPKRSTVDRQALQELYDRGMTLVEIAARLNATGIGTPSGRAWNEYIVWHWIGTKGRRKELEELQRAAIVDAKARGLTNAQAASEFNERQLPRAGNRRWTADVVRQRRAKLKKRANVGEV